MSEYIDKIANLLADVCLKKLPDGLVYKELRLGEYPEPNTIIAAFSFEDPATLRYRRRGWYAWIEYYDHEGMSKEAAGAVDAPLYWIRNNEESALVNDKVVNLIMEKINENDTRRSQDKDTPRTDEERSDVGVCGNKLGTDKKHSR